MIPPLIREIGRDVGIAFLVTDHAVRRIVGWEDDVSKAKAFFGRRIGDRKELMDTLSYIELISKIASEAPVLLPNAMKLLSDINQVNVDFQKLLSDFQGIKAQAATVPAPAAK